jgi:hypothetical protein
MSKNSILKEIGFSDEYLKILDDFSNKHNLTGFSASFDYENPILNRDSTNLYFNDDDSKDSTSLEIHIVN